MSDFAARVAAFFDEYFRLEPVAATAAGMHAHDGRWPDLSDAGRRERLAFADRWEAELRSIPDPGRANDEAIDRELLLLELDALRFAETELREDAWDALGWVYLIGGGLFPLIALEFAPPAERLASFAARLEGIPSLVAAARVALGSIEGRPASRLHAETALRQLPGVVGLIADGEREAAAAAPADEAVAAIVARLGEAAAIARTALATFEAFLRDELLPAAEGEGRLGPDLFRAKLRRTLRGGAPTAGEILARAEREATAVRAEMVRLARDAWPAWLPGRPMPDGPDADVRLVGEVLDAIGRQHQPADALLDFCRAELHRIEGFVWERDLVTLADEPLDIRWTPVFLRSVGGAMLNSPGPLDRGQKSFFAITPIPEDWPPERVESALREDNDRMLRLLTIHEAIPGHYLQGAHANRCPSLVRTVFWSGVFAEGWAVYATQVMMDAGYGADDPALLLTHWKFYLRSVLNAILDVRIHAHGMTEDEAVSLLVEGGFQEPAEARGKYDRARLSSTQLVTYFVGSMEMWELERERRRRLAAESGDPRGADAVPEQAMVGGFGETPGFVYGEHLDEVLAHGSPPPAILRRIVLDG